MNWKLFLFCGFVSLVLALLGYRWLVNIEHANLHEIQRLTAVKLPKNIAILSDYDNGEFELDGKYRLDPGDINSFLAAHSFKPIDPLYSIIFRFPFLDSADRQPPIHSPSLVYFSGCNPGDSWLFLLDKQTGELWVKVEYPDWSGDKPGCPL